MEQFVPTLDTCKKLKEAAFPQNTEFRWLLDIQSSAHQVTNEIILGIKVPYDCAAPTLTDILEQLPENSIVMQSLEGWEYYYVYIDGANHERFYTDNPAESAALLWLDLNGGK